LLVIAVLVLLLASTSKFELNYNNLADYVKFNRIVLCVFILSSYLAYNTLDVEAFGNGIGIYGGVFKITVLSQVFDILLFIIGGIITILTCFLPYNFRKYDDSESIKMVIGNNKDDVIKLTNYYTFFKSKFKDYHFVRLSNYYPNYDYGNKSYIHV
jgi:hypothetical protein